MSTVPLRAVKPDLSLTSARSKTRESAGEVSVLTGAGPAARVEALPDGRHRISLDLDLGPSGPCTDWVTAYPLALVREIYATKGAYVCDEIMREEDPCYVENAIRHEVFGYVEAAQFAGKRVLDFWLRRRGLDERSRPAASAVRGRRHRPGGAAAQARPAARRVPGKA